MDKNYTYIKERVLYIAEFKGISKERFLESIGMTYGSFKGTAKKGSLNSDAIAKLYTNHPDINPRWLLTGEGDMLRTEEEMKLLQSGKPLFDQKTQRRKTLGKSAKYGYQDNDESRISEPPGQYVKVDKHCELCKVKDQLIEQQEVTINVLQKSIVIMQDRIDDLESSRDKKTG